MGFKTRFLSKFPRLYLLSKPNRQVFDNIKAYGIIKKHNLFDTSFYLSEYPDVAKAGMNPIVHYMWYGYRENKKPMKDFDGVYYSHKYPDALESKLNPLSHYALYGLEENREYKLPGNDFKILSDVELGDLLDNHVKMECNVRRRVLYLVHEPIGSFGGTGFTSMDIIEDIQDDYDCYILTSTGSEFELWFKEEDHFSKLGNWSISLDDDLSVEDNIDFRKQQYSKEALKIYSTILSKLNIDLIHINHLINHTFDISTIAEKLEIPIILSIHDYYYICPSIHLVNNNHEYCQQKCQKNEWTCQCIPTQTPQQLEATVKNWQKQSQKFLKKCTKIITPSKSTTTIYINQYPELKDKITTITHGRDLPHPTKIKPVDKIKKPIRILFPGYIGTHKGSLLIKKIKEQDTENQLELHFMGTTYPTLKKYGKNHGRYTREEFTTYVKNINPHFIGIFSTVPETYSHTLTESWNTGTPVIATQLGALEERIKQNKAGYLIPYDNPKEAYQKIIEYSKNINKYNKIIENIQKIKFKTQKQMTTEYKKIYNKLTKYHKPKYKISITIPTYNTGKFLHESIGSLIKQTIGFENIEILIVDDKSTDQYTIDLIKEYSEKFANVKAIFLDENSGFPGRPRNIGIENSTADYVMVMDHDDSYNPEALEKLYKNITHENADICICNFNQVFEEGTIPYKSTFTQPTIKANNIKENPNLFTIPAAIWTRLYNKKFLQKNNIKFPEGMLAEDVYVNTYTLLKAKGIIYLNNYYGYQYKIRDTEEDKSTIHIRNKKYIDAILNGFIETSKIITQLEKDQYSDNIFKPHLTSWLYTIVLSNTNTEEKKYLYQKATPLYKKRYIDDPYFKGKYNKLVKHIQNEEYDKALEETEKIKETETNMNEELVEQIRKNKKE